MANVDDELTVAQRLGRLLDRGLLPAGGPAEAAERLIERLERPARVALLGLPGSGKSAILNLLAGTIVVPETLRLPTIIVQHGPEPRMLCTLSDGRTQIIRGDNLEQSLSLSPAMITLELDLPALKVISLLEVAAGPQDVDQRRAALWAGKRADILIWCTTSYLPKEQLVWEGMPDAFKDNGFLLLTKVDLLGGREAAVGMHYRVEQRAGGEFRQVLSISAKEARAAMPLGGQVDRDRFRESGAGAVISTIKTRVQSARRADTDTAELILARQAGPGEESSRRGYEKPPIEKPLVEVPIALVRTSGPERHPLTVVAKLPPEEVTPARTEQMPLPADVPKPEGHAKPEAPVEILAELEPTDPAVPTLDASPGVELNVEPEVQLDRMDKEVSSRESEVDPVEGFVARIDPEADPSKDSEPNIEIVAETPSLNEIVLESDPANLIDLECTVLDAVAEAIPDPVAGFLTSSGGQRLSDRIKQIRPSATNGEAPLFPLRATWKSRNDVSPAVPEEVPAEPVKTPRARPIDQGDAGRLTLRVSPANEAADIKASTPEPESGDEQSGEDRLRDLRWSDADLTPDQIVQNAPIETSLEVANSREASSEDGDRVEDGDIKAEDLALARFSALRGSASDPEELSPGLAPEPEEEPASEAPLDPVNEDPILARIAALRDAGSEPSFRLRSGSSDVRSGPIRSKVIETATRPPAEPIIAETLGDGAVEDPGPQTNVAAVQPEKEEPSRVSHEPFVAEVSATDKRSLSVRLSHLTDQSSGIPVEPAGNMPLHGSRLPRSGLSGSPRVTVIRERRVEVQPIDNRDRPRIAPASGNAVPAVVDESKTANVAEVGLMDLAISVIVVRSAELFSLIDPTEKLPVDLILDHGRETTERVIDVVSKGTSAQMRRINGSLGELQDVIMLMQLEKGHAPADDTLTLLLQLRRELETLRSI